VTIRKGQEWGEPFAPAGDEAVAMSDAEVVDAIGPSLDAGLAPPPVVLRGGDLFHMLGGRPAEPSVRLPLDVVDVVADGRRIHAIGHVIARRRAWSGHFVVIMNGAYVGEWYLGPKAHPDDGRLDITEGALGWRDRLAARRRAATGSHLPHPGLTVRRAASAEFEFDRAVGLYVDGRYAGTCTRLSVTVMPDAATVVL
jgi:hypothetical protein